MLGRRMILIICILMELERGPLLLKAKKILSSTFYSEPTRVWWWCVEEFQQKKNNNSELTRDGFEEQLVVVGVFFSSMCVRRMCDCYLPPTDPPISLNNARLQKDMCWFVIRTDKLISCVQVGLAGSLHDDVTLLQVHNFSFFFLPHLIFTMTSFFPPTDRSHFYSQKKKKEKRKHDENTRKCQLPCISGSLPCSYFLCVTSQNSKIYSVNDFQ